METSNLMSEGITLMLFGMGFVFVFLTSLVVVTSLMSWLVTKIEKNVGVIPEGGVHSPSTFIPPYGPLAVQPKTDDTTLISILTTALHKYRSRNKM